MKTKLSLSFAERQQYRSANGNVSAQSLGVGLTLPRAALSRRAYGHHQRFDGAIDDWHNHGCRLLVHDFQAKPGNSRSLIEFENLDLPEALLQHHKINVVVISYPWPQYRSVPLPPGAKLVDPLGLRRNA